MLKVVLRYPGSKATKQRKFKVVPTTKGSVLRNYIGHCMSQFRDAEYLLIPKHKSSFLKESKPLTKFAASNVVKLSLVMKVQSVSVSFVDGAESTEAIQVDKTVEENIEAISPGMGSKCVFAFKKVNQDWYQITASSKELVFQGWNGEPLLLIRRLVRDDLSEPRENLDKLFVHAKVAANRGLSLYSPQQWAVLAALQFVADEGDLHGGSAVSSLPQIIRNDEAVMSTFLKSKQTWSRASKADVMKEYLRTAVEEGNQCCFIDKVKIMVNDQKKLSYRWLYISKSTISVTREFGVMTSKSFFQFLDNIKDVTSNNDLVVITFLDGGDWKIKSENMAVLKRVVRELTWKPEMSPNVSVQISLDDLSEEIQEKFQSAVFDMNALTTEKARVDEVQPGISKLVCPDLDDGDSDYDPSEQIYRELKIISPLIVPDEKTVEELERVPDFSWLFETNVIFSLKYPPARMILFLVCLLIVCFMFMEKVL